MSTEIVVPALGESVVEATVARWLKNEGEAVRAGEAVVELETDKVDLEVSAEKAGTLIQVDKQEGEDVRIGDVLGLIRESENSEAPTTETAEETVSAAVAEKTGQDVQERADSENESEATPVAKRMAADQQVDLAKVSGSGPGGRITKEDVTDYLRSETRPEAKQAPSVSSTDTAQPASPSAPQPQDPGDPRGEERVRMSRRRRTIAQRLVQAQQTAAMLTTFNEIDMSAVMEIRGRRKSQFIDEHGVSLGFTSFFVKAAIGALKAFPELNAEIQGNDILLKKYFDIGIAIGAEDGLVVPVLRDADRLSFAQIEQNVKKLVQKSQAGELSIDDLVGGTFTITNGGVFGSLLSTPILNPPQVGILGLHKIEERPIVSATSDRSKEIVIRPMMYVALSYDHRIVDGREAVQFLVEVKKLIEDPEELLLAG